jgi:hypothetical protein
VDFVAESLVSWMDMIDGGSWELEIKSWRQGIAVLSEDAFQVMAYVSRLVRGIGSGGGVELGVIEGVGYVYSLIGSLYRRASVRSCRGRYGNAACKVCMVMES